MLPQVMILPGLGHLSNLPYSPGVFSALHPLAPPGVRVYMGGDRDPVAHVKAQHAVWTATVDFFTRKLLKRDADN